jgi:uncharacterized protein (TIGR00369 family)
MLNPRIAMVLAIPLHRHLGVEFISAEAGKSLLALPVAPHCENAVGVLHGGILYALSDVASYVALVGMLSAEEDGVTHDIHVSVMRPAPAGTRVLFHAEVRRKGRSLAFIDVEARSDETLIACARVTKSLVPIAKAQ